MTGPGHVAATQMRFMEEMMATMKSLPVHLKLPKKRGTFYARKSGSSGARDVEKLMRGFDISLQASPLGEAPPTARMSPAVLARRT